MKLFTLLCCINPTGPMDDIDEFTFYQMVNPLVPVLNIKIFDKSSQVKAFVQIENEELAEVIIKDLHGKQMNIGKIKVFVSHKKFVAFDKSLPEILAQATRSSLDYVPPAQYSTNKPALNFNPYFSNSVTNLKNKTQSYSSWKMNIRTPPPIAPIISDKVLCGKQTTLDYDLSPSIYVKKKMAQFFESDTDLLRQKKEEVVQPKLEENNACIKIANIDMKHVSCQMLFNLFGCFGNVTQLSIQESVKSAILEYDSEKSVNIAIKYTDCIKFCGKTLSVAPYNGPNMFNEPKAKNGIKPTVYTNHESKFRFTGESGTQVVPPSRTLRFANLPRSATLADVKALVSKIHVPLSVNVEKTKDKQYGSFLIEFNFLYEGFKVLSMLHDTAYEDNKLFVSFLKRKSNTS